MWEWAYYRLMEKTDRDPGISRLPGGQIRAAADILARAFFNDPKLMFVLPQEPERRRCARDLFEFELRYGMNYGRVDRTSPELEGVCVWLPSARSEITLWRALRSGGMNLQRKLGKENMKRLVHFSDFVDAIHRRDVQGPHCYLFFIGIDPAAQGKGYGGKLITEGLSRLDRERMPCYLTTQNEKNVGLYRHFGFEVVGQLTLPGTSLVHTGMLRRPRGA
jgi:ribosomal protein S18 acetylase RimI-like enzyme